MYVLGVVQLNKLTGFQVESGGPIIKSVFSAHQLIEGRSSKVHGQRARLQSMRTLGRLMSVLFNIPLFMSEVHLPHPLVELID